MGLLRQVETPNIQGSFDVKRQDNSHLILDVRAPFSTEDNGVDALGVNQGNVQVLSQKITFNAQQRSSIYSGSKLQVPALQVLPCIRY